MLTTIDDIQDFCKKHLYFPDKEDSFKIKEDLSVDIDGSFDISNTQFVRLPININIVKGHFFANSTQLTTLEGFPQSVGGILGLEDNHQLKSMVGLPGEIEDALFLEDFDFGYCEDTYEILMSTSDVNKLGFSGPFEQWFKMMSRCIAIKNIINN